MTPHQLLDHNDSGQPWPAQVEAAAFGAWPTPTKRHWPYAPCGGARGERPRGFKFGFTIRTLWERYKVYAPIWDRYGIRR